ncbi:PREDICTED: probable aquaporin NIP-type isoform X2 [Theobroma cacao]|uniref:Probable aquaporin NIP-type isoform X2 n=1 Tax=Theobroma cacao TaxID=3641 RepID=A0AB32W7R0_THECC|nr:PREDICTED: probable aquaporin NIP-type isoform X2 [Theobroma cacao]
MATKTDNIEEEEISKMEQGHPTSNKSETDQLSILCSSTSVVTTVQKLIAELIGTYFIIFAGCGSVAVNKIYGSVTFPGVCVTWGLIVMVMIYSVGHISGAHFNPAVTITFAIFRRIPFKQVPVYVAEIIISFLLMFVISGATTDNRAVGELGGIAVGMTIMLNVFVAGPISGASMNPARSIGPALVKHVYKGLWLYIFGPIIGTIAGAFIYNLMRFTDKSLRDLTIRSN